VKNLIYILVVLMFAGGTSSRASDPHHVLATCLVRYENMHKDRSPTGTSSHVCTFLVRFAFPTGINDKVFTCNIESGQDSCTTQVSMNKDGVDGAPMSVAHSPLTDKLAAGCMYSTGYPRVSFTPGEGSQILVEHFYTCAD